MTAKYAKKRMRQSGFTMIELMVTLAVAAILAAIAFPNFRDFLRRNAVISHTNELIGDMNFARETATTESSFVSICASATPSSDTPTCVNSKNYSQGWIVYKAPTAGTVFGTGAGYELMRAGQAFANASVIADISTPISFDQRGAATQNASNLLVCAKKTDEDIGTSSVRAPGQRLSIQASGRISSTALATASDDAAAQALCTQ